MIDNLMAQKKILKGKPKLDSLNGIAKQSNSVFTLIWKYFFFFLQHNRFVQSPLWMDGKMPSIGPVWLCEHGTFVYGSITWYLVNRKMMPCLKLLPNMTW